MEKFDYVILSENNKWLSTGIQKTQEELDEDIIETKRLFKLDDHDEVIIIKAPKFRMFTV